MSPADPAALRPRIAGTVDQVRALLGLRLLMVRDRRRRGTLFVGLCAVPVTATLAVVLALAAPAQWQSVAVVALPALAFSAATLAVLAPLGAGGSVSLFPDEQLTTQPVRAGTQLGVGLLVTPIQLSWLVQALLLGATAAFLSDGGVVGVLGSLVTVAAYLGCVGVVGQAVAWAVIGVRQQRRGRRAVRAALWLGGAGVALTVWTGDAYGLVRALPTAEVAQAVEHPYTGQWFVVLGALGLLTVLGWRLGCAACAWALRRPADKATLQEAKVVRRRATADTSLGELVRVTRASVWRSVPLRRGLYLMAVLPALATLGAGLQWSEFVLMPGLVVAGVGLLYGVNCFALDGPGALWLCSLPHRPEAQLVAMGRVLAELCLLALVGSAATGALRMPRPPTAAEAAAVLGAGLATTIVVVAFCLRLSVLRPFHAPLRGPRDTPAPPATMAGYAARLALRTTTVSLVFAVAALTRPAVSLVALAACAGWAAWSLRSTLRRWRHWPTRAQVCLTVAGG